MKPCVHVLITLLRIVTECVLTRVRTYAARCVHRCPVASQHEHADTDNHRQLPQTDSAKVATVALYGCKSADDTDVVARCDTNLDLRIHTHARAHAYTHTQRENITELSGTSALNKQTMTHTQRERERRVQYPYRGCWERHSVWGGVPP